MARNTVTVLGINGHVGHHAAKAFAAAGWQVTGMGRTNRNPLPGVRFIKGDAADKAQLREAIGDSEVVVNALNLPYDKWDRGRMEALYADVLEVCSGRTMLFPGNIYNFDSSNAVLTPELEQRPSTPRGAIRQRVEAMFETAARRGDLQVIILRAGDFYGPESSGDWFDQVILREARKGKVAMLGTPGVGHAWAYLPDLGRAFEILARHRDEFDRFATFHFAGHFVTPEQMVAAIAAAAPGSLHVSRFPWILMSLLGLANPIMREVAKMGYLWQRPMALRDDRLDSLLGPDFGTPFETAVAATAGPFFAERALAA